MIPNKETPLGKALDTAEESPRERAPRWDEAPKTEHPTVAIARLWARDQQGRSHETRRRHATGERHAREEGSRE